MQSKAKGKGNLSVLMNYAGRRRVLTYLSWVLSAVSALTALVPFIFVWLIVREVIEKGRCAISGRSPSDL